MNHPGAVAGSCQKASLPAASHFCCQICQAHSVWVWKSLTCFSFQPSTPAFGLDWGISPVSILDAACVSLAARSSAGLQLFGVLLFQSVHCSWKQTSWKDFPAIHLLTLKHHGIHKVLLQTASKAGYQLHIKQERCSPGNPSLSDHNPGTVFKPGLLAGKPFKMLPYLRQITPDKPSCPQGILFSMPDSIKGCFPVKKFPARFLPKCKLPWQPFHKSKNHEKNITLNRYKSWMLWTMWTLWAEIL